MAEKQALSKIRFTRTLLTANAAAVPPFGSSKLNTTSSAAIRRKQIQIMRQEEKNRVKREKIKLILIYKLVAKCGRYFKT